MHPVNFITILNPTPSMAHFQPLMPLNRRQFMARAATMTVTSLLAGCGEGAPSAQVQFLKGSIPPQLVRLYQNNYPQSPLDFISVPQLQTLFETLQARQASPSAQKSLWQNLPFLGRSATSWQNPSLWSLGDAWLASAIRQNLLQPLPLAELDGWRHLHPRWSRIMRRNAQGYLTKTGPWWGAPYRWGTTLLVYSKSRFKDLGWTPQDWQDLWRSPLNQKIALLDQSREVIGLTLKKLGYSYNEAQPEKIPELLPALQALQTQVKFYSSRHSLQSLLMGDVWLVLGWSNEVLPLLKTQPDLAAVIPTSGTSLWSDVWVAPRGESLDLFLPWINNSWQRESVNQISLLAHGASPALESWPQAEILPAVRHNPLINVPPSLLARCEFLEPLTESSEAAYAHLWQQMRQS